MAEEMTDDMVLDSPSGVKRKAHEALEESQPPLRIKALDSDVVNKIAAGEIILAPAHALKELIENAVDAGATSLDMVVKDGGLKLLQITDNGCGIQKEDLAILCERHTTSKLSSFDDLTSLGTYGFRGEALASISHVAHLTVTTKTENSTLAWRAHYLDGKLAPAKPGQSAEPKAVAGRPGTQITVEDLFFNMPTRRRALRSASDEFNKIIDVVGRHAVHCSGIGFTCKKASESFNSLSVQAQATTAARIRQVYSSSIANELMEFSTSSDRWGFKAHGLATNANYHVKKTTLLLFINHRSVESTNFKKAIEQTYANVLPKGGHPFVYMSLEIDPARVDVNVHPTKREVHFLHEDDITQAMCMQIEQALAAVDTSRTFTTQTLLPGAKAVDDSPIGGEPREPRPAAASKRRRNSNELVRTDASVRKITTMFQLTDPREMAAATPAGINEEEPFAVAEKIEYESTERKANVCRLRSVKELRSEVRDSIHTELTDIMATHTFVGVVDERRRLAAIQGSVKMYLIDYGHACFEYLYQLCLTEFGNFGFIRFDPPLALRELLLMGAEAEKGLAEAREADWDVAEVVDKVTAQLIERREMLLDYFSLEISAAGDVVSLPLLVKGYTPPLGKLPQFLLRLGPNVAWTEEKACFHTFLRELASFYVPEQLPAGAPQDADTLPDEFRTRRRHVRWAVENIFFPAFKKRLIATKALGESAVLEVADLKRLYRVFERC